MWALDKVVPKQIQKLDGKELEDSFEEMKMIMQVQSVLLYTN